MSRRRAEERRKRARARRYDGISVLSINASFRHHRLPIAASSLHAASNQLRDRLWFIRALRPVATIDIT